MIIPHDAEECECCEKTLALRAEVERLKALLGSESRWAMQYHAACVEALPALSMAAQSHYGDAEDREHFLRGDGCLCTTCLVLRGLRAVRAALDASTPATEQRGGLTVRAGAPVCSHCRDEETRVDCRACGGTGLANLDDVRPDVPRTFTEEHVTTAFLRAHLADNGIVDLNVFLKALLKEKP